LTSEDSCLDKDHTSSINNSPFLYALWAKGVSQEKVMQEKSPALSTGCWCLKEKKSQTDEKGNRVVNP